MDPFVGEIRLLPFSYAPRGWALCNGQLIPISTNTALFSIIGTTYGGNGKTNFGLPDLRGRAAPGAGQGPGLRNWGLGTTDGARAVTLVEAEMPEHKHLLHGLDNVGNAPAPAPDKYLARDGRGGQGFVKYLVPSSESLDTQLAPQALMVSGQDQEHENCQPFLPINFCIALMGIYPARS